MNPTPCTNPPDSPAAAPLGYASRARLPFIGRHRRALISLALAIAIAIPIYRNWQTLKHRVLWLYWSHRAAEFVMPAKASNVIVDGAMASQLVLSNAEYQSSSPGYAFYQPLVFRRLAMYDSRLSLALSNMGGDGVVFLGTLQRPDGTPRLVLIAGGSGITGNLLNFTSVLVLPLARWSDPLPPAVTVKPERFFEYNGPLPTPTRFKTAMRDARDPTHIVLEFEASQSVDFSWYKQPPWTVGATGVVDAHLQNDDSILFTLRSFTGSDPNIRVGTSKMTGDVQTLEKEATRWSRPTGSPATAPPARGRGGN